MKSRSSIIFTATKFGLSSLLILVAFSNLSCVVEHRGEVNDPDARPPVSDIAGLDDVVLVRPLEGELPKPIPGSPIDPSKPITLKIISPKENEVLHKSDFEMIFELTNYDLEQDGNHIHVILDNMPYRPHYDEGAPVKFEDVAAGTHVIRVFPSRPWHESWKNQEAFAMVTFHVQKKGNRPIDYSKPVLTFSRPKGIYKGEKAKEILFDFWLWNADLREGGYQVRYTLNGKSKILTKWEPVWWKELSTGTHTVIFELLDSNGNLIKNGWNRTKREFKVEH
jgi:hypothetical protein